MSEVKEYLTYKGKPLVRCKDTIYYGNMSDEYVIKLDIIESEKSGDITTAKKVAVYLMRTDSSLTDDKRIIKKSEKNGLYEAMDIGSIWLSRQLGE